MGVLKESVGQGRFLSVRWDGSVLGGVSVGSFTLTST